MVSFRYHLVSITAVFLALALGIGMGVTVIDRATVDLLESRLDSVKRDVNETNKTNDQLRNDLEAWDNFSEQTGDKLFAGRLQDVPAVVVSAEGVDGDLITSIDNSLVTANANAQGTLIFSSRMALSDGDDVKDLAVIVGSSSTKPTTVRSTALQAIVNHWADSVNPDVLPQMIEQGFARWTTAEGGAADPPAVTLNGTRFTVVSSTTVDVPDRELLLPFVNRLTTAAPFSVVAAEPAETATKDSNSPVPFLALIRSNDNLRARVSTVDNVDAFRGRAALILAIQGLTKNTIGHYGIAEGADRLVPEVK